MPLINEILELAEKDLDITEILRYIVTANPKLKSEIQIPSNTPGETVFNNDEVIKFILSLYNVWIGGLSGQLCLNVDTSYLTPNIQNQISGFTEQHQFPTMLKPQFPDIFSIGLYDKIRKARQKDIQPISNTDKPINKHLFDSIARLVKDHQNFARVNAEVKSDSNRIIKPDLLKTFENFKIALKKVTQCLIDYLDTINPAPKTPSKQETSSPSFLSLFSCNSNRNKEKSYSKLSPALNTNTSINCDPSTEYVSVDKPDFLTALDNYKQQRLTENQYHFWGTLFCCCLTDPFSLKEKIRAVEILTYWKKKESNLLHPKDLNDTKYTITERDIAAIRDHRLGTLANEYEDDLPAAFKNAEHRVKNNNSLKNQGKDFYLSPSRKN